MKTMTRILLALTALAVSNAARADTFDAYTDEEFETYLTDAANNGAPQNTINLHSTIEPSTGQGNLGYYGGNYSYSSASASQLTIQAADAGPITIDGMGLGRGLNITSPSSTMDTADVTVSGITFIRNCGNYQIGALRVAAGTAATIMINNCKFLSRSTNGGIGLEIASGLNLDIQNCFFIGKTNATTSANYDGHGLSVAGITGTTTILSSTMAGNYEGWGANVSASSVFQVYSNVFQNNSLGGLFFEPSSGSKIAQVFVSTNVFSTNSSSGGAEILNFSTLFLATNLFEGNSGGGVEEETGNVASNLANTFVGNSVDGGVFFDGIGTNILVQNTFLANSGSSWGGAYFGSITSNRLSGNTFSQNVAAGGGGGGIYCSGGGSFCALSNNVFNANQTGAGSGGAVQILNSGTAFATISGNTFTGNTAPGSHVGGAIYISGDSNLITRNTFEQNSSGDGGGAIYDTAPAVTMTDNLFFQNSQSGAPATGGAVYCVPSINFYMINNTIVSNTSAGGGGGLALLPSGTGTFDLYNNIIFGNSSTGGSGLDLYLGGSGSTVIVSNNDINDISGVYYGHNNINQDPEFFDPINGDFHLQSSLPTPPGPSPCLNAGYPMAPSLPLTDLDGSPRVNNGQVDIGCYELNTTAYHPADVSMLYTITTTEYNNYSNAWKSSGAAWSSGPNPIPANYVTRAGFLLLNDVAPSGTYYNDGSQRPVNWKPSAQ